MTDYADIPPGFELVPSGQPSAPQYADIPPGFSLVDEPSTLSDIAKSLPQYGETAVAGTLGLPGDIAKLIGSGAQALGYKINPDAKVYGSQEIQGLMNQAQGGPLYQPQTPVGQGVNVAAGLAPAMLGGPESLLAKGVTRVAAPAAAITGIQASSLPEGVKPYLEGASVLLTPFAANKIIGATLKRFGVGVLPTTSQMKATNDEFAKIHAAATTPAEQAQAYAAWKEVTQRYLKMKSIEGTLGGVNPARMTPAAISQKMSTLNPNQFSPVEQAQLANTIAEGGARVGAGHTVAKNVAALAPSMSVAGAIPLINQLVAGSPSLSHLIMAGVVPAIGLAAKVAYPHLGQSQIQKLIAIVKRGLPVKGAPTYTPATGGYSPLQPGLATTPLDQGSQ